MSPNQFKQLTEVMEKGFEKLSSRITVLERFMYTLTGGTAVLVAAYELGLLRTPISH